MSKWLAENPQAAQALSGFIVILLGWAGLWLQARFPTQTKLVNEYWTYLQAVVGKAMDRAVAVNANPEGGIANLVQIEMQALAEFAEEYLRFEGKPATAAIINAARKEIAEAVQRATGGGA